MNDVLIVGKLLKKPNINGDEVEGTLSTNNGRIPFKANIEVGNKEKLTSLNANDLIGVRGSLENNDDCVFVRLIRITYLSKENKERIK